MFIDNTIFLTEASNTAARSERSGITTETIPQHSQVQLPEARRYKFIESLEQASLSPVLAVLRPHGCEKHSGFFDSQNRSASRPSSGENLARFESIQLVRVMLPSPSINSKAATNSPYKEWLVAQAPRSTGAPCDANLSPNRKKEEAEEVVTLQSAEDDGSFRGFNVTLHYVKDQHSSEVPDFRLESSHFKSLLLKSRFSATSLQEETERSRPIDTNVDCIALLKTNKAFMQYIAEKLRKDTKNSEPKINTDTSQHYFRRPVSPGDSLKLSIPLKRASISRK